MSERSNFEIVETRADHGYPQRPARAPEFPGWGRPGRRLKTVGDIRHELSRVYRQAAVGAIAPEELSRATYALTALGKLAEVEQHEQRIADLECLLTQLERGKADGR